MMQALDQAEAHAREHGAETIHRMVLRVGKYSGADADALRLAFEAAAPGTRAASAILEIEAIAARCSCSRCHEEFEPAEAIFACPTCGMIARGLLRGDELELATLEVS